MSASWAAKGRLLRQDAAAAPRGRARGARKRSVYLGERHTAPQGERLPKQRGGPARGRGAGAYARLLEAFEVELAVGDANQAAGRPRDDQVAAERLAQVGRREPGAPSRPSAAA